MSRREKGGLYRVPKKASSLQKGQAIEVTRKKNLPGDFWRGGLSQILRTGAAV